MLKIVKITYIDNYICIFAIIKIKFNEMKNAFTFLVAFFLLTCITAFQEESTEYAEIAAVPAKIMVSENSGPIAIIDKNQLDSIEYLTGIDLSGLDPATIQNEQDLKKGLINLIGSFLTMVIMFFLRRLFPTSFKFEKSRKSIN